jgi:XRE family transcriptional regulator, fatty acid utilization regulator
VCGGKMFSGARLRRLRNERGLTQAALAQALGLSTSYVNQLENDQRPITVPVLIALTERFDLLPQYFSSDTDARLVATCPTCSPKPGPTRGHPLPD